jgi:hypothetical protein
VVRRHAKRPIPVEGDLQVGDAVVINDFSLYADGVVSELSGNLAVIATLVGKRRAFRDYVLRFKTPADAHTFARVQAGY